MKIFKASLDKNEIFLDFFFSVNFIDNVARYVAHKSCLVSDAYGKHSLLAPKHQKPTTQMLP